MLSFETTCAFFVASLLMAMTPGPDVIIVLTQSSLYGMRAGVLTTLGLMTGLLGHTLAVALGRSVLFQTSEAAFTALKFLGAAYLLYLAWQSFRSGVFRAFLTQSLFPGYGTLYRRGFLSNITNPKVTLFCLAVLPQFVEPERGHPTLRSCRSAACMSWPASSSLRPSPRSGAGWRHGSTVPIARKCL